MNDTVQKAIENITWQSKKFPKKEFETNCDNKEEAIQSLRSAVDRAIAEGEKVEEDYILPLYAIFLLGEFQDRESFPRIMELACLPSDTLDFLIGDAITEGLCDILYCTYNGDLELLKQGIYNQNTDDFAKAAMLEVMHQLYLDKKLGKQEWQDFMRGIVYKEEEIGDYIYAALARSICECHFMEMLPELRRLYQDDRVDPYAIGDLDDCIDTMFLYTEEENCCRCPINTAERLKGWAMFEKEPNEQKDDKLGNDFMKQLIQQDLREEYNMKIGRNDPCPCGSGKKYKQCCLNKPKSVIDTVTIESRQEKEKWLRRYPPAKKNAIEGRIYLEDFYSKESIETDKLIYLALNHRAIPIWRAEQENVVSMRQLAYLTAAWKRFVETVEKEGITSFSEYDEKHSIHYPCAQWTDALKELLREEDDYEFLKSVGDFCRKMEG